MYGVRFLLYRATAVYGLIENIKWYIQFNREMHSDSPTTEQSICQTTIDNATPHHLTTVLTIQFVRFQMNNTQTTDAEQYLFVIQIKQQPNQFVVLVMHFKIFKVFLNYQVVDSTSHLISFVLISQQTRCQTSL